jgi:hypothetical protein
MSELQGFKIVGTTPNIGQWVSFRLLGRFSLISSGIAFARERQVKNLMVVTLGLTGFQPPNVIERYYFISEWVKASGYSVHVAVVTYPEMIDHQKFGVTVAANIGFVSDVFTSEEEASTWLRILK